MKLNLIVWLLLVIGLISMSYLAIAEEQIVDNIIEAIVEEAIILPEEYNRLEIVNGMDNVIVSEINCEKKEFYVDGGIYNFNHLAINKECDGIDNRQELLAEYVKIISDNELPKVETKEFSEVKLVK